MKDKELDKGIEDVLKKTTQNYNIDNEKVWNNIVNKLNEKKEGSNKFQNKFVVAIVAICFIVLVNITYGKDLAKYVKSLLAPQKLEQYELEGMKEYVETELNESEIGYILYFDKEIYELTTENDTDIIKPKNSNNNDVPEVYLKIYQVENSKPIDVAKNFIARSKEIYDNVSEVQNIDNPINCLYYSANNFKFKKMEWSDSCLEYYFVDNTRNGTFIIEKNVFLEATEGHGARFNEIIKGFKIRELLPDK